MRRSRTRRKRPLGRSRLRRGSALALVALLGAGLAGGCSGKSDPPGTPAESPTVSPASTASPTRSEREQNIAEAEAAVQAFFEASDRSANGGYADWRETVLPLVAGEFKADVERQYADLAAAGRETTGSVTIDWFTPNNYYTDPETGVVTVKLNACVDASALRKFNNGVEITPGPNVMMRHLSVYQVERAANSREWLITNADALDDPC